jgi:Uma2 family endonuclease
VNRKVREYLSDGVKIIWVIDPKLKTVAEYTQAKPDAITKRKGDVLSGGDVAKGFELVVSEIFEN